MTAGQRLRYLLRGGGLLFGEIAMFTPSSTRTLSCMCETDVETLFIASDDLRQLYFQNPQFGFQLVRLIVGRLVGQVDELERQRRRRRPAAESERPPPILQGTMTLGIAKRSVRRPEDTGLQERRP